MGERNRMIHGETVFDLEDAIWTHEKGYRMGGYLDPYDVSIIYLNAIHKLVNEASFPFVHPNTGTWDYERLFCKVFSHVFGHELIHKLQVKWGELCEMPKEIDDIMMEYS